MPLRCLLTPETGLVRNRGGVSSWIRAGAARKDGGMMKKTGVEGASRKETRRWRLLTDFGGNARVRWMNVIEGCPVEFARAFSPCFATCAAGAISYQDEKRALISVTLGVARLLNGSYVRGGGENCRRQLPSDSKYRT